jgi:branched-chain amino acid transport system substrate-binding protein
MRRHIGLIALVGLVASITATGCLDSRTRHSGVIEVGAIYPTGGAQGRGGLDEYRGVKMAAELVNASSGTDGRRIRLKLAKADSSDQVPRAMASLLAADVPMILGSYGSTISRPAAEIAENRRVVFWETGAVGELGMAASSSNYVFRFAPTGNTLGRSAVSFTRDVALPRLGHSAHELRFGVAYVDDVYGRAVGQGATEEIGSSGLQLTGEYRYELANADYRRIVERIIADRVDVLFVSAYLEDGIALRKETVRQQVPLVASVGTSSSYCMHEFGAALGGDAVGLFASDKPDGHIFNAERLSPSAAKALRWSRDEFKKRYDHEMTASALSGFAGAIALFRHVLPRAKAMNPSAIAEAARGTRIDIGGLPNGSGLEFNRPGLAASSENLRATSVIWEWVAPQTRAVVWPPSFATAEVIPIRLKGP